VELEKWLDQVHEEALDPELPICDPHHHLWDVAPWGPRYLISEIHADLAAGHNVVSTVFVEGVSFYRATGPEEFRCVGETEFARGLAAMSASGGYGKARVARAIVATANMMLGHDVAPVLEAQLAAAPALVRGIRYLTNSDSELGAAHPPRMMEEPAFRDGIRQLARYGLTFDAYLFHTQIPELTALARACPDVTMILDHLGCPIGVGRFAGRADETFAEWKKSVAEIAREPNVVMKLGGIGMKVNGYGWRERERPPTSAELADATRRWFEYAIEQFGTDRCMFESNFPVDKESCSYTVLWNSFKRIASGASASERAALFHDTATRVYRISD
jgi:predicted TIM-barrel fold metal-dependent hydrolase